MKITVLVENGPGANAALKPEFGLSLLIESGATTILFDTGASSQFAVNADLLGIDLDAVDWVVLSHGHYDHGGGLETFLSRNRHAKVILKRGAEGPHFGSILPALPGYLHRTGLVTRYIGLDPKLFERRPDRFLWADDGFEPSPGVRVLTLIPRIHDVPKGNRFLLALRQGRFVEDDFSHELVLVVEGDQGAVVLSGCAHSGILNMVEAARRDRPGRPLEAVVGGFHLTMPKSERMSASPDEVRALTHKLGGWVAGEVYTGHCTGKTAFRVMHEELGERLHSMHTGLQFEV